MRKTVNAINPSLVKLNTTISKLNSDKLAKDLEGVLSNANQTTLNLKNITSNLNDPKTLLMLQQTLDSARSTFINTQKITADLDELTGNADFRNNIKNLVNGLGKLVSSAEQLEQQAKLAQSIEPLNKSLNYISKMPVPLPPIAPVEKVNLSPSLTGNLDSIDRAKFVPNYRLNINSNIPEISPTRSTSFPASDFQAAPTTTTIQNSK